MFRFIQAAPPTYRVTTDHITGLKNSITLQDVCLYAKCSWSCNTPDNMADTSICMINLNRMVQRRNCSKVKIDNPYITQVYKHEFFC